MASRRPIYRKQEKRSTSKIGLMFCLLLAGGVLLVPIGGDLVHKAKMKVRDLALSSGVVDFNDCVVTPDHALACTSDAAGMPLPAALRRMQDTESQVAAERAQRLKAESAVHQLALEVERLSTQVAQGQISDRTVRFFPAFVGDVTPTARTGADDPAKVPAAPAQAAPNDEGAAPDTVMPPSEED
ncbi:MAG TPA: hypothetical protein VFE34_11150 [Dongiaceae bacterium]|jgi:hypothetical protein|nr:hypothetical protein [Dongiaceae bacterium]